ncbi:MAG TPA: hypothetical protein PK357_02385 [Candidatus Pacearchaeota archaeon]|nr:hypothetical protein [Candidatus Pacearchaeota archaeon]
MKKDLDLVRIVSYLFFDGHLYNTLKCFYFSSNNLNVLKQLDKIVQRKFKIKGKFYLDDGGAGKVKTHKYRVFNAELCRELEKSGVPKGCKTTKKFSIPNWIKNNKKFLKEFVKVAYFCEGSMKESDRKNPRIIFHISKADFLLDNGIDFINEMIKIIHSFNIKTTSIGIYNRKKRKDGVNVKELRFRIITQDNNKFIKHFAPFFNGEYKNFQGIMG